MVQWFYDKSFESEEVGQKRYFICDAGNKLCKNAFSDIYHINEIFYYKFLSKFTGGALAPGISRLHQQQNSKRHMEVIGSKITQFAMVIKCQTPLNSRWHMEPQNYQYISNNK